MKEEVSVEALTDGQLEGFAASLEAARRQRRACEALRTGSGAPIGVDDAYKIQTINVRRRQTSERASLVGYKIGITSEAVQSWLGVDQPDFGRLLSNMEIPEGGLVDVSELVQPRAEAELAFQLGRDLRGPGVTTAEVLAATDFVVPSIEVIDSRIADWKITIGDTIADNASSGLFVLGSNPISPRELDFRLVGMTLRKRGRVVATGAGAACLGSPVNAVAWLVNTLGERGIGLEAGQVVLSGALGPVTSVAIGDWLEARVGRWTVGVRFGERSRSESSSEGAT